MVKNNGTCSIDDCALQVRASYSYRHSTQRRNWAFSVVAPALWNPVGVGLEIVFIYIIVSI